MGLLEALYRGMIEPLEIDTRARRQLIICQSGIILKIRDVLHQLAVLIGFTSPGERSMNVIGERN